MASASLVVARPTTAMPAAMPERIWALAAQDIFARKYFWPLVSDYGCYRGQYDSGETPVARRISSRVLTLPLYPDLAAADVKRICGIFRKSAK